MISQPRNMRLKSARKERHSSAVKTCAFRLCNFEPVERLRPKVAQPPVQQRVLSGACLFRGTEGESVLWDLPFGCRTGRAS
jgi:hypothetical protein